MRALMAALVAVALAGCSVGMQPGGQYPKMSFSAPVSYQEAYRRADAQGRACPRNADVTGDLFSDNRTGVVRFRLTGGGMDAGDLARVDISERPEGGSEIQISYQDKGGWDKGFADAMRQSIESGSSVCRDPKYRKFG